MPQAKDTGTKYKEKVVSSGPYKFATYPAGKNLELDRNPNYDPATDPESGRKALPDKLTVQIGINAADLDNRLMSGDLDVDIAGTGVQAAAQGKILASEDLKKNTDNPTSARTLVLADQHRRRSVRQHRLPQGRAAGLRQDRLPAGLRRQHRCRHRHEPDATDVPGHADFDLYDFKAKPQGDPEAAKAALTKCGKPDGFDTIISYRNERPKEKAVAESLQQSLAKVGIKVTIKGFPAADYIKLYAGKPDYAKANSLGIIVYGWGADWPDGFGFLSQIVDSRVIRAAGNTNLGIKVPAVDQRIDQAMAENDITKREAIWGNVDKSVMDNAVAPAGRVAEGADLPARHAHQRLRQRRRTMYDYAAMGMSRSKRSRRSPPTAHPPKEGEGVARWQPTRSVGCHRVGPPIPVLAYMIRRLHQRRRAALHRERRHLRHLLPPAPPRRGHRRRPGLSLRRQVSRCCADPRAAVRLGFTDPIWVQYGRFAKGLVVGSDYDTGAAIEQCPAPCLGYSFITQNPVLPDLLDRLPVTLSLAAGAAVLWLLGGVSTGVVSALKRGSFIDRAAMSTALAGVSLPIFFTGLLALSIFSYGLGWTAPGWLLHPASRRTRSCGPTTCSCRGSRSSFLYAAAYARLTRAGMLETMNEDYIRTARAKGLKERDVVVRHGLRAALTPIVTIFGLDLGLLLGGAILTETTFSLHGIGKYAVDAVANNDLPKVLGVTILGAVFIVIANLVVDLLYAVVDPRVRVA